MRKPFILIFCSLLGLYVSAQEKEFFQLEYKGKSNYKEFNNFLKDSVWRFNQTVAFDMPKYNDEESWVRLVLEIRDTSAFLTTKILNLPADISITRFQFASWTVWMSTIPPDSTSICGKVELIKSNKDEVGLKFDLVVLNTATKDRYYYKGERVFRRTNSVYEFYEH